MSVGTIQISYELSQDLVESFIVNALRGAAANWLESVKITDPVTISTGSFHKSQYQLTAAALLGGSSIAIYRKEDNGPYTLYLAMFLNGLEIMCIERKCTPDDLWDDFTPELGEELMQLALFRYRAWD